VIHGNSENWSILNRCQNVQYPIFRALQLFTLVNRAFRIKGAYPHSEETTMLGARALERETRFAQKFALRRKCASKFAEGLPQCSSRDPSLRRFDNGLRNLRYRSRIYPRGIAVQNAKLGSRDRSRPGLIDVGSRKICERAV
jgi:hypothetical protein